MDMNTTLIPRGISDVALVNDIKNEVDKRVGELSPAQLATWNEWILLSQDGHACLLDWVDGPTGAVERVELHHHTIACKVCIARKAAARV